MENFSQRAPNENYQKFFDKFSQINILKIEEWKPVHLIGYFVEKYQKCYGTQFKFKFNSSAPSKCFEMFQIQKLGQLLSTDPTILKKYIDWIFENKVPKAKRKITSISFLTRDYFISDFKYKFLNNRLESKIDRTSLLPPEVSLLLRENGYNVEKYSDLSFLTSSLKSDPEKYQYLINLLTQNNFDIKELEKVV